MANQQKEMFIPPLRKMIAKRMSSLNVSQGMLANAVGMSQGNLSRYLTNKGNINSKKVDDILFNLELHVSYDGSLRWDSNYGNCVHCRIRDRAAYKKKWKT